MQITKAPKMFKFAALSAALALQGLVFNAASAQTSPAASTAASSATEASSPSTVPTATPNNRKHRAGHHHKKMHRQAAMWVPGYGSLNKQSVQALALSDSQQKLLTDAQTAQKQLRSTQRDAMKSARTARLEQLKAGKLDPHAALTNAQDRQQQAIKARQDINQKWLALWDTLDATQQKTVATAFSKRAEKMADRANKRSDSARKDGHRANHSGHNKAPAAKATS